MSRLTPLKLARALKNGGVVATDDGAKTTLHQFCTGITENTVKLFLSIVEDPRALNRLRDSDSFEIPKILVRRLSGVELWRPEHWAFSREQSAALLTIALQTRTMPLIVDQPEDELGYGYVVHLIVPKVLSAKARDNFLS